MVRCSRLALLTRTTSGEGVAADGGFYTAAEAARIARVPRSTLDYWARTGLVPASQRTARPRLFSFEDLRDIVAVEKLRQQGAKTYAIRAAIRYVRDITDVTRLAHANFQFDGVGGLVWHDPTGSVIAPHQHGQYVLHMEEVFRQLGADPDNPTVLHPVKGIRIDPQIRGGAPVIEGTRIPAQLIAEFLLEGTTEAELLELYPSLTPERIEAVRTWERLDDEAA